jgi:hypothetical protein
MGVKKPSFSGYVTKANLECEDGRTILPDAFKHQDGERVPLVYQHNHTDLSQVLGHVILTNKGDGVWGDAYLNETSNGKAAGELVHNKDIDKFSIWAKNLVEKGRNVLKGNIKEVSLVLAGANPGALITESALQHGSYDLDEDVVIVGFELEHAVEDEPPADPPAAESTTEESKTIGDVLSTLSEEQQQAVNQVIEEVVTEAVAAAQTEAAVQHDALNSSQEDTSMTRNIFDNSGTGTEAAKPQLKHSDQTAVLVAAREGKVDSLRDFVRSANGGELMHAVDYGVDNIEVLFPDAQALMRTPTWVDRRQEWVKAFMAGTSKSPFSRVKTVYADITADEARAKGYIKATQKVEEVFPVFKRSTGPTMIYKKQKLDRQDIIDVTDFDIVAWMKAEMRGKLDEELARAGLLSDGRSAMDDDKIQEPTGNTGDGIRSVLNDHELYTMNVAVVLPTTPVNADWNAVIDAATLSREDYMGSGNITAFMTYKTAATLLTIRDEFGHRMYRNLSELANDMDINQIVRVPSTLFPADVLMIALDLADYNFGTNAGGQVTLFDDFDIDFNQYKYLIETYLSGALTLPYSAMIFRRETTASATINNPTAATFVDGTDGTGVITIPDVEGVTYRIKGQPQNEGDVLITSATTVVAKAEPGYTVTGTSSFGPFTPTGP